MLSKQHTFILLASILSLTQATSNFTCVNPEVTNCYQADIDDCWTALNDADTFTEQKAEAMDDQDVAAALKKLLLSGSEFKEMWKVEQPGDGHVYFSILKFEQIGFHEDFEIM